MSDTYPDSSLRILRIASDTYPEVMGGLSLHVHHLSRVQAERGHDVTVLASDQGDETLPRQIERAGYTIEFHREFARPLDNSIIPSLANTLRKKIPYYDIVHAHSHLFFSTNLASLEARFTETPLVITNHGVISQTAPRWLQQLYLPTIGRFTLNSADRIMCYTETDRQRLQDIGIDAQIAVVQNGIDCSQFHPTTDDSDGNRLLYVGRLKESKGVQNLISALKQLRKDFDQLTLTIVGDGPHREQLEDRCAALGVREAVTFTGIMPNTQLPEIYNQSTVLVLPSQNEGLPRTVLEALACETPFVSTDLPQLRPIAEKGGITASDNAPSQLAAAIETLLANEGLRDELGKQGRELVQTEYSWSDTVRKTTQEYYRMLGY